MLVLADRGFAPRDLFAKMAATGAGILIRVTIGPGGPKLPVLQRHCDGSYLIDVPRNAGPRR
jgi:hypothetical protein